MPTNTSVCRTQSDRVEDEEEGVEHVTERSQRAVADLVVEGDAVTELVQRVSSKSSYFGWLARSGVDAVLNSDGQWLLRSAAVHSRAQLVLSVRWQGRSRHFMFLFNQAKISLRGFNTRSFSNLEELVTYYSSKPIARSQAKLGTAAIRPDTKIPTDRLKIEQAMGTATFGKMNRGQLKLQAPSDGRMTVAARQCPTEYKWTNDLGKELETVGRFNHPHIVKLYGVVREDAFFTIVMEFCPKGSLLNYLKEHKTSKLSTDHKIRFCVQVAAAMRYLCEKGVTHGRLAAKNVLLDECGRVKVSDYGGAMVGNVDTLKVQCKQMAKWTAPELMAALSSRPTFQSDVWSFGSLLWEVMSCGDAPFGSIAANEALQRIQNNQAPRLSDQTPKSIESLMHSCWTVDPSKRPTFGRILTQLINMPQRALGDTQSAKLRREKGDVRSLRDKRRQSQPSSIIKEKSKVSNRGDQPQPDVRSRRDRRKGQQDTVSRRPKRTAKAADTVSKRDRRRAQPQQQSGRSAVQSGKSNVSSDNKQEPQKRNSTRINVEAKKVTTSSRVRRRPKK